MAVSSAILALTCMANVPAGDLIDALESLAKQCGVEVIYPSDQLEGRTTRGVSGTLESQQAFRTLLEGTPLVLREESGALLITRGEGAPAPDREAAVPIDEIEVRAWREKLSGMLAGIDRLEDQFFREYNRLNTDRRYDVVCGRKIPTGSHVALRSCESKFITRALADAERARLEGHPFPTFMVVLQSTPDYQKHIIEMVAKHPGLFELLRERDALARRYEELRSQNRATFVTPPVR